MAKAKAKSTKKVAPKAKAKSKKAKDAAPEIRSIKPRESAPPKPPQIPRRKLRYILFRCREDKEWTMDRDLRELAPAIRAYFDYELDRLQLSWASFTYEWDVSADDGLAVISPDIQEWADNGGQFEGKPGELSETAWIKLVVDNGIAARRKPPAFTHQG